MNRLKIAGNFNFSPVNRSVNCSLCMCFAFVHVGAKVRKGSAQEISKPNSSSRSNIISRSTIHRQGSSKKSVLSGDSLASIERFSRLPGREGDASAGSGLVPNGRYPNKSKSRLSCSMKTEK